jgi:hypothetical protein
VKLVQDVLDANKGEIFLATFSHIGACLLLLPAKLKSVFRAASIPTFILPVEVTCFSVLVQFVLDF